MLNFKLIATTEEKDLGVAADSSLKTSAQQAEAVRNRQMERWDKCNDKSKDGHKNIACFYSDYSNKSSSTDKFAALRARPRMKSSGN